MTVRLTEAKHGRFLVLDNDRYIGRLLLRDGEYSEGEVELFSQVLGRADTVVEAGANIGAHTVPLAKMAANVVAFEPQRHVYHLLCGNLALNGLLNVQAYPAGLGAEGGFRYPPMLDYDGEFNFGGVPLRMEWNGGYDPAPAVPLYTVDQLNLPALRLLKADVEGMEIDVVRGASETIRRCRPYLYLEDTEEGNRPLYDLVESFRYRVKQHHLPLVQADDPLNPFPGYMVVSKNIFCVPAELDG